MMVHGCLSSCYNELPQPEIILSPEDSELNYFLWMPGVRYEPRLQKKLSKLRSITAASEEEVREPIAVDQVVEDVISTDQLTSKFQAVASNGKVDLETAATLVREVGSSPSQAELAEFFSTYGESITYDQMKELIAVNMYPNEDSAHIENILRNLALDHKNMDYKHLEHILMNYGEPLTAAEMNAVKEKLYGSKSTMPCAELSVLIK